MAQAKTLTAKQLQAAFGVSHMTIFNWRAGTSTKDPLPVQHTGESAKPRVSYRVSDVKSWAKRNKVEFAVSIDDVLNQQDDSSEAVEKADKGRKSRTKH